MEWRKQFNRLTQMASQGLSKTDKSELLTISLQELERKLDDVKTISQKTSNKLTECLISNIGNDFEKRMKKLPMISFANCLSEFSPRLHPCFNALSGLISSIGDAEDRLAKELIHYEMDVELKVVLPLKNVAEKDVPAIQKLRKQLTGYKLDMDAARNRLQKGQGQKNEEAAHDEFIEARMKVDQTQDQFATELYTFATREEEFCKLFLNLIETQSEYHRRSLAILEQMMPKCRNEIERSVSQPIFKTSLENHLIHSDREIAVVIEECVRILDQNGMHEEGLFRVAGGKSRINRLKAAFDANMADMDEYHTDVHCVADVLKQYLRTLPEPLMTFDLYGDWMSVAQLQADRRLDAVKTILDKLPKANYSNLRYLIKFLARLSEHSDTNKMTPSNLAIVIGPNLLWPREDRESNFQFASVSVELMLTNADILFPGVLPDLGKSKSRQLRSTVPDQPLIPADRRHSDEHSLDFLPRLKSKFMESTNFYKRSDKISSDTHLPQMASIVATSCEESSRAWQARPLRLNSLSASASPVTQDFPCTENSQSVGSDDGKPDQSFRNSVGHRRVASAGLSVPDKNGHPLSHYDVSSVQRRPPSDRDRKTRSRAVSVLAIDFNGISSSSNDGSPNSSRRPGVVTSRPAQTAGTIHTVTSQPVVSTAMTVVGTQRISDDSSRDNNPPGYGDLVKSAAQFHSIEDLDNISIDLDSSPKQSKRRRAPAPPAPLSIPVESSPTSRPPLSATPASQQATQTSIGHRRVASANVTVPAERPNIPPPMPPKPAVRQHVGVTEKSGNDQVSSKPENLSDMHEPVVRHFSDDTGSSSNETTRLKTAEARANWFQSPVPVARDNGAKNVEGVGTANFTIARQAVQSQIDPAEHGTKLAWEPSRRVTPLCAHVDADDDNGTMAKATNGAQVTVKSSSIDSGSDSMLSDAIPVPVARARVPPAVPPPPTNTPHHTASDSVTVSCTNQNPGSPVADAKLSAGQPSESVSVPTSAAKKPPPPTVPRQLSRQSSSAGDAAEEAKSPSGANKMLNPVVAPSYVDEEEDTRL